MHHCVDISLNTNWPYFCQYSDNAKCWMTVQLGFNSQQSYILFSSLLYTQYVWGPLSPLGSISPKFQWPGCKADHLPPPSILCWA